MNSVVAHRSHNKAIVGVDEPCEILVSTSLSSTQTTTHVLYSISHADSLSDDCFDEEDGRAEVAGAAAA